MGSASRGFFRGVVEWRRERGRIAGGCEKTWEGWSGEGMERREMDEGPRRAQVLKGNQPLDAVPTVRPIVPIATLSTRMSVNLQQLATQS